MCLYLKNLVDCSSISERNKYLGYNISQRNPLKHFIDNYDGKKYRIAIFKEPHNTITLFIESNMFRLYNVKY